MKRQITVRVRRGDNLVTEEATLWIDELPPEYQRGHNKKNKTRRHKRQLQDAMHAEEEERPRGGGGEPASRGLGRKPASSPYAAVPF